MKFCCRSLSRAGCDNCCPFSSKGNVAGLGKYSLKKKNTVELDNFLRKFHSYLLALGVL